MSWRWPLPGEGRTTQALLGRDRHVHPQHDAGDQCRRDGQDGPHRVSHHRGPSRHPADARGRADRRLQLPHPLSGALCSALAHLRDRGADRRATDASSGRSTRPRCTTSLDRLKAAGVEAVAVCLLWSIVNPAHELRVGRAAGRAAAGRAGTRLSHQLNPTLREYRRASSCCIDASLKPLMSALSAERSRSRLGESGLAGQMFAVTSQGGIADIEELAERPILSLNSGPSMAPVAGRHYAPSRTPPPTTAIVTDAGGTTYDVEPGPGRRASRGPAKPGSGRSTRPPDRLPLGRRQEHRRGRRQHRLGRRGGLLHVGPESAGSDPGPVCYGRGGDQPTVTDAALVLGYIDPDFFLGGRMALAVEAAPHGDRRRKSPGRSASRSTRRRSPSSSSPPRRWSMRSRRSRSSRASIREDTVIMGGGGAAGFNAVAIARRLGAAPCCSPRSARCSARRAR